MQGKLRENQGEISSNTLYILLLTWSKLSGTTHIDAPRGPKLRDGTQYGQRNYSRIPMNDDR